MDNYKKIIEAFSIGDVDGIKEKGIKPDHIETQISHLFIFPESVYKICKRDNAFFNEHFRNLADRKSRQVFYKSDFFENNYFSPEVYLSIFGVAILEGRVVINNKIDGSEDVMIKMRRIDLGHNLSMLLHKKTLSEKDFQIMGFQQTKAVALYPHQPITKESYYEIMLGRLNDVRDWMYSAPKFWSKKETDEIVQIMIIYVEKNKKSFINLDKSQLVVSLDNHSDNIFYENGRIFFLDIYPPKEAWLITSSRMNIYRPATDILILMGEKYAKAFIQGYKDYYGSLDESHELFYFLYSAVIQAVSLHNLSRSNQLKKQDSILYKKYIIENIAKLANRT
jgi:aminoglycoside phosphotransferase family enzyme